MTWTFQATFIYICTLLWHQVSQGSAHLSSIRFGQIDCLHGAGEPFRLQKLTQGGCMRKAHGHMHHMNRDTTGGDSSTSLV